MGKSRKRRTIAHRIAEVGVLARVTVFCLFDALTHLLARKLQRKKRKKSDA